MKGKLFIGVLAILVVVLAVAACSATTPVATKDYPHGPSYVARTGYVVWRGNDFISWVHIAAEITNIGDYTFEIKEVLPSIYTDDGKSLDFDTRICVVTPEIVGPGETAYIYGEVIPTTTSAANVQRVEVFAVVEVTSKIPQLLTVENLSGVQTHFFGYRATGRVINNSEKVAENIKIAVGLYDDSGSLLGVLVALPKEGLAPGAQADLYAVSIYYNLPPEVGERVAKLSAVAWARGN